MAYNLGFISDNDIYHHVAETVKKYKQSLSINLKEFNSNLIDPIKLTFDAKIYNKDIQTIIDQEISRQTDKSNTNHIGYFHQNIFKYLGNDWTVPENGYDVINLDKNIFVEIKNKHNTMNSSSSQKTYMRMQNTLLKNPHAHCMLVEVIAKNSQNVVWKNSLDGFSVENEHIRRVSIDKFYEFVTDDKFAFRKLCEKLPQIISDTLDKQNDTSITNSVFNELKAMSPNLLKSLYLLAFKKYEGFSNLDMPL